MSADENAPHTGRCLRYQTTHKLNARIWRHFKPLEQQAYFYEKCAMYRNKPITKRVIFRALLNYSVGYIDTYIMISWIKKCSNKTNGMQLNHSTRRHYNRLCNTTVHVTCLINGDDIFDPSLNEIGLLELFHCYPYFCS